MMKVITDKEKISGRVRLISTNVLTGEIEISDWYENYITAIGRTATLRGLGGIGLKTNEGKITYGAVGTGATPPSASSTILSTELFRKVLTSAGVVGNILTLRMFFNTTEANGTLTNFGLFGEDATAVADSGTLIEIVAISKTKTSATTLSIEVEIILE